MAVQARICCWRARRGLNMWSRKRKQCVLLSRGWVSSICVCVCVYSPLPLVIPLPPPRTWPCASPSACLPPFLLPLYDILRLLLCSVCCGEGVTQRRRFGPSLYFSNAVVRRGSSYFLPFFFEFLCCLCVCVCVGRGLWAPDVSFIPVFPFFLAVLQVGCERWDGVRRLCMCVCLCLCVYLRV